MPKYSKGMYVYSKIRKTFGNQPLFQNVPAHIVDSISPNVTEQKQYMLRNPVNREVQVSFPQSEHEVNTAKVEMKEQAINHVEGGWPREVHLQNEEHVERYRRHVRHDESYVDPVLNLAPTVQHYIDQNNAIEMYETYFETFRPQAAVEKYNVRISNVFRDSHERPISCVVWTNESNLKLAVSYSQPKHDNFESNIPKDLLTCHIWNVNVTTEPEHKLQPDFPCWQLACSPADPEVFVAGLENGTVQVYDIRSSEYAMCNSSVYNSHRAPVTALLYTNSRTNTEFFTGSLDGQCFWWDVRNLKTPIDSLPMTIKAPIGEENNLFYSESITALQYDRSLPTRFLCGTMSGLVVNVNRLGRTHSEVLPSAWNAQTGPVRSVHRSPCTTRMFLTCGDWTVKVWSEEVRTAPIILTKPFRHEVTDVAWAPLRYSCYMVACADGIFYYWDFLRKYREPVATLQVSKHKLTKVTPHSQGQFIAVGDTIGSVNLLQLSENMVFPGPNDKQLMHQTYDRETKREHILDNRIKELKLKARIKEEEEMDLSVQDEVNEDQILRATEEEYFRIVREEIIGTEESSSSVF